MNHKVTRRFLLLLLLDQLLITLIQYVTFLISFNIFLLLFFIQLKIIFISINIDLLTFKSFRILHLFMLRLLLKRVTYHIISLVIYLTVIFVFLADLRLRDSLFVLLFLITTLLKGRNIFIIILIHLHFFFETM